MNAVRCIFVLAGLAGAARAQLTPEQKVNDFEHLAALYAKQYGPYEWKKEIEKFDLLEIAPWLEKVKRSGGDLDFYDILSAYVASLNDAHDVYVLPSSFSAQLGFTTDVYDGRVLIDAINRQRLPLASFPFVIGDELVSIDGKTAAEWIEELWRYSVAANPRTTRRFAASFLTFRPQAIIPRAIDLGDSARVVTRSEAGELLTHDIPWIKLGLPLTRVGPTPSPKRDSGRGAGGEKSYSEFLADLGRVEVQRPAAVLGVGQLPYVFSPPSGYTARLPRTSADFFSSGTFNAGGFRIGLIRIPSYSPANLFAAIEQFRSEILFFEQNTDGLIVDQMRNPGGQVFYVNTLLTMLMPERFRSIGFEIRATSRWVLVASSALASARAQNAPPHVLDLLTQLFDSVTTANRENRGRTGALPVDDATLDRDPATDFMGRRTVYTKPLLVLMDEISASGADMFPATIQDNGRGLLFGMRTMGAGGNVVSLNAGNFTEGFTSLTQSLMVRKNPVTVEGYPSTAYIENVGVHPDVTQDYMTRENLMRAGRPFVDRMVETMIDHIRRSR